MPRLVEAAARLLDTPFDLGAGELYRHALFLLGPAHARWVLVTHHIALDSYGLSLCLQRAAHYRALVTGAALPELGLNRGHRVQGTVSAALTRRLNEQARALGAAWPTVLFALSAAFWHEHTGERQVVLAVPMMGRLGSVLFLLSDGARHHAAPDGGRGGNSCVLT